MENEIFEEFPKNESPFEEHGSSSSKMKKCLMEYSAGDKIEALIKMLEHNKKCLKPSAQTNFLVEIKKPHGVKECLEEAKRSTFQTIISELKNTVMNSYWNKELGKPRYQISRLPVGMNPLETTFGKKSHKDPTVASIIHPKKIESDIDEKIAYKLYRKTHNYYQPAEQMSREYKKPYDKNFCFGKVKKVCLDGSNLKKILTSTDPTTEITPIQAEYLKRTKAHLGKVKNFENAECYMNVVHGKASGKELYGVAGSLTDCSLNKEAALQLQYLEYINSLRQLLKRRISSESYLDLFEELTCLDKKNAGILEENGVFEVLLKYEIYIDRGLLGPLLDILEIRKEGNVKYMELLDLLNVRCHFPTLPKIQRTPVECLYYRTTYKDTMETIEKIDTTKICRAVIPSAKADSEEPDSVSSLIFPKLFMQYGLTRDDFSKPRGKEEIKSIFKNIGVEFSNDSSFESIWQEGLKKDGAGGVSVDTFRNLLNKD